MIVEQIVDGQLCPRCISINIADGELPVNEEKAEERFLHLVALPERDFEAVPFAFRLLFHFDRAEFVSFAPVKITFDSATETHDRPLLRRILGVKDILPFPTLVRPSVNKISGGSVQIIALAESEQLCRRALSGSELLVPAAGVEFFFCSGVE